MRNHPVFLLIVLISIHCTQASAFSQEFVGVVSGGMGGAGRAALDPMEVGVLNPAGLMHLTKYYGGVEFSSLHPGEAVDIRQWKATLADASKDAAFPASFSYVQRQIRVEQGPDEKQQRFHLSVADEILKGLAIGVSVHHFMSRPDQVKTQTRTNADLGLLWTPSTNLGLALIGYNLMGHDEELISMTDLRRTVGVGINYMVPDIVNFRADYLQPIEENDDTLGVAMVGLERGLTAGFIMRLGYQWNGLQESNWLTAGLGWVGPRLSFGYAYQKQTWSGDEVSHLIDLWLHFW